MNKGHRKRGWVHVFRGHRECVTDDGILFADRDLDGRCWRLGAKGREVGKSRHFASIARWVRTGSYKLCLDNGP